MIGLDGMLYFLTSCGNDGTLSIQVTFKLGTNPDIATVQTQNRVNIAMPRLPPEVQRAGRHGEEGFQRVPDGASA